jgi:tetratricopeptide (TPR) repeat protein
MIPRSPLLNPAVAAFLAALSLCGAAPLPVAAQDVGPQPRAPAAGLPDTGTPDTGTPDARPDAKPDMAALLEALRDPSNRTWRRTERQIVQEWSRSGSAAMDLLLQRGRDALRDGDTEAAIAHLTALTDHAPDFAEGWNARAIALFNAREFGPALADIARALTLNPHHFGALSGLAMILEETGDKPRALAAYRAALAIHPRLDGAAERADRLAAEIEGQDV